MRKSCSEKLDLELQQVLRDDLVVSQMGHTREGKDGVRPPCGEKGGRQGKGHGMVDLLFTADKTVPVLNALRGMKGTARVGLS